MSAFPRNREVKFEEACSLLGSHMNRVADKIFDYFDDEDLDEMTELCKDAMKKSCNLQGEYKHDQNLIKQTADKLKEGDNDRLAKDIYKELKHSKPYQPHHEQSESYKNLLRTISDAEKRAGRGAAESADENGQDEDEELQMTEIQLSTKDPFTQKEMVDPVKSKLCHHSFERSSVMALLKNKPRIKCPMPGCGYITVKDLVPNNEMKRLIEERQAKNRN